MITLYNVMATSTTIDLKKLNFDNGTMFWQCYVFAGVTSKINIGQIVNVDGVDE